MSDRTRFAAESSGLAFGATPIDEPWDPLIDLLGRSIALFDSGLAVVGARDRDVAFQAYVSGVLHAGDLGLLLGPSSFQVRRASGRIDGNVGGGGAIVENARRRFVRRVVLPVSDCRLAADGPRQRTIS